MNINYMSMLKLHNLLKAYQQEYICFDSTQGFFN